MVLPPPFTLLRARYLPLISQYLPYTENFFHREAFCGAGLRVNGMMRDKKKERAMESILKTEGLKNIMNGMSEIAQMADR